MKFPCAISKEQIPQIASAFEIKIHRQKRDIISNVDEAETIVEFDAIKNGCRFRSQMNVVQVDITVAIPDPVLLNSPAK